MTRETITNKALTLIDNNSIVALEWATGVGKSACTLKACNNYLQKNKSIKVLLVVAELAHINNWKEEIDKWNYLTLLPFITITTYASLKKYREQSYDFIILDEGHHVGSDIRLDILQEITYNKLIILSATLKYNLKETLKYILKESIVVYKVSLQQAINWGILPKPSIYVIPLQLNYTDYTEIIIEKRGNEKDKVIINCSYTERWNYLKDKNKYPNLELIISCTPKQKYEYLNDKIDYFKRTFFGTNSEHFKNKWLQYGSQRKRFLGELKTNDAKLLIKKLKNKRFVCFCSSIEQANLLGKENAIHSKKEDKKASLKIIQQFNDQKINNLFAVGMIQEGQNLNNIEVGIIIQLDGEERAFIQKSGRVYRADNPIQFILYYKDTRDEEYLQSALENIDKEYISIVNNIKDLRI